MKCRNTHAGGEYPSSQTPLDAFSQATLDALTAFLVSWKQGPGNFGGIHLHACWGESSVLTRGYHGQSVAFTHALIRGFMRLYEATGEARWRREATELVSNLLFLGRDGGFIHAANEYEPAYSNMQTCPIQQGLALLGLLDYYGWVHADPLFRDAIPDALDRHLKWFQQNFWMNGPRGEKNLDRPGWCGVTNQDLVIVAALARYGRLLGEWSLFNVFGLPTLESYLSPRMYHAQSGLFQRGDAVNYVERTSYYTIVVDMLEIIRDEAGAAHLQEVIDNVMQHVFDAAFIGRDGLQHLAWGANTDVDGNVTDWIQNPLVVSNYPAVIPQMWQYLARYPDVNRESIASGLEKTLASYVFADGTLPTALAGTDAIFEIVPNLSSSTSFWLFLMERLAAGLKSPRADSFIEINRAKADLAWIHRQRSWEIVRDGRVVFGGLKVAPSAVMRDGEKLPVHEAGGGTMKYRVEKMAI